MANSTAQGYFASNGKHAGNTYENPTSRKRFERAQQLAKNHNATPTQIALAWLQTHPFPTIPLLGTTNPAHLEEALKTPTRNIPPQALTALTTP